MAEAREALCGVPENLTNYSQYPLRILNVSTKALLAKHLNPQRDSLGPTNGLLQDWRGLAEVCGLDNLEIENIQRADSQTSEVLRQFEVRMASPTIGLLIQALCQIERFDILNDIQVQRRFGFDVENYIKYSHVAYDPSPVQDDHVDSTCDGEWRPLTVGEAITGVTEYFDAFVCCTQRDGATFIPAVTHHLEEKNGFKLFIADRDLLPDAAMYVDLAKLIKERCRKMIIVLSPDYIQSEECKFATLFAMSLDPAATRRTLIPIRYENCAVPNVLNFITLLDYTRVETQQWFWQRLAASLHAGPGPRNLAKQDQPFTSPVCGSALMISDTAPRQCFTAPAVSTYNKNNLSPSTSTTDGTTCGLSAKEIGQQQNIRSTTHLQQSIDSNNSLIDNMSTAPSAVTTDLNIDSSTQQKTVTGFGNYLFNKLKQLRSKD